jgi:hypothetical protein
MVVGVVHSTCRVDLSRLDSRALQNGIRADLRSHGRVRPRCWTWGSCACRLCGVHDVAHVPALGARSRVLRGNVPGYRLPDCGYVGPDEDVGFFEGGVCHTRPNLEFGP